MLEHSVAPVHGDGGRPSPAPDGGVEGDGGRQAAAEPVLAALDLLRQQQALRNRLVVADALALTVAWTLVLATGSPGRRLMLAMVAVAATLAVLAAERFYRIGALRSGVRDVPRALPPVLAGVAAATALGAAAGTPAPGMTLVAGGVASLAALAAVRSAFTMWLRAHRAAGRYPRPVVLIGGNDEAAALEQLLTDHPELGYRVLGVVAPRDELVAVLGERVPWLGDLRDTLAVVDRTGVTDVVVAGTAVPYRELQRLTRELPAAGVGVQLSAGVHGVAHRRLRWQTLAHEPVLTVDPADAGGWHEMAKRLGDVLVSSVCLVLVAPVLLVAGLAVKLQDGGPVLYVHDRVGRHGRTFRVLKLRTMVPDAERRLGELHQLNARRDGPLFKADRDPRVTRVGQWLRQTSIDELPQLVNVLRGEMSLVGPRPALPSEADQFDEELRSRRLSVRPGITGLWQIEARDNPSFGAYRRLDLFYVENWSLGLDLMILWSTVGRVTGRGLRTLRRTPKAAPAVGLLEPSGTSE